MGGRAHILVVGGAGYIGSHVVHHLLDEGFRVAVLDNLSLGHRELVDSRAAFFNIDLLDQQRLLELFNRERFDVVMHFAARSLVGESTEKPLLYYENNIGGMISLLHAMRASCTKYIIFSSTAAVYGEPEEVPIPETHPCRPTNTYGWTKLVIEQMLRDLARNGELSFAILRYFNAAGAAFNIGEQHTPETHLIPLILKTAKGEHEKITLFGTDYDTPDGTCIRDYIHILDLADAHLLALKHLLDGGENLLLNLGSGTGNSVKEVVEVCKKVTEKAFSVEEGSRRPGDPSRLVASIAAAQKTLGWSPKHPLREIIASAWEWENRAS